MICSVEGCGNKQHNKKECSRHLREKLYGLCVNGCTTPAQAKHGFCSRCVLRNLQPPKNHRKGHYINSDTQRYCWACDTIKTPGEFAKCKNKRNNMCKNCTTKRSRGYDRDAIIELYKEGEVSMCLKCGAQDRLEVDHIVPVSLGGSNDLNNLQILCRTCNASKLNKNANDYRKVSA